MNLKENTNDDIHWMNRFESGNNCGTQIRRTVTVSWSHNSICMVAVRTVVCVQIDRNYTVLADLSVAVVVVAFA